MTLAIAEDDMYTSDGVSPTGVNANVVKGRLIQPLS